MTRRTGFMLGGLLIAIYVALGVAGLVLIEQAASMPEYIDQTKAESHLRAWPPALDGFEKSYESVRSEVHEFTVEWSRKLHELRTSKWDTHELSRGLLSLSLSLIAITAWFGLLDIRALSKMETPKSLASVISLSMLAWLIQPLFVYQFLSEEVSRKFHPVWADSIGFILFPFTGFIVTFVPVLLLLVWLTFRRRRLPARLWVWNRFRPIWSSVWTMLFAVICAPFLAALSGAVVSGPFTYVPTFLLILYLLLSARAVIVHSERAVVDGQARL